MSAGFAAGSILSRTSDALWEKSQSKLAWDRTKRLHQKKIRWQVADLKAAGLNPILAAQQGTPMGSAPSSPGDKGGAAGTALTDTFRKSKMDSAQRAQITKAMQHTDAQIGLTNAQTNKTRTDEASVRQFMKIKEAAANIGGAAGSVTKPFTDAATLTPKQWDNLATSMGGAAKQGAQRLYNHSTSAAKATIKRINDRKKREARKSHTRRN